MKSTSKTSYIYIVLIFLIFLSLSSYTVDVMSGMMSILEYGNSFSFLPRINKLFLALCLLYIIFNSNKIKITRVGRAFTLLCVYSTLVTLLFRGSSSLSLIAAIWIPYIMYCFGQILARKTNYTQWVNFCFILMYFLVVYYYFTTSSIIYSTFDVHLNIVYVPLLSFLLVLFVDKKIIKFFIFIITLVLLLQSGKRAGLLALFSPLIFYLCYHKTVSKKRILITLFVVVICLMIFFQDYFSQILVENRTLARFTDNGESDISSGRIEIYIRTIQMFLNSSPFKMLIGHGFGAVEIYSPLKMSAHNDFLEVLYDYGFIGLLIYVAVHYNLIRLLLNSYKRDCEGSIILSFIYFCLLTLSLISQLFNYPYFYLITLAIGYYEGKFNVLLRQDSKTY